LPEEWKESIFYLSIRRATERIVVIMGAYHFCQLRTKFYQHPAVKVNSICKGTVGYNQCGFRRNRSTTDPIFCIRQILEKIWEYNEALCQLFIDLKKAYHSVRREVLYRVILSLEAPRKSTCKYSTSLSIN
jgi:hypothetical protein